MFCSVKYYLTINKIKNFYKKNFYYFIKFRQYIYFCCYKIIWIKMDFSITWFFSYLVFFSLLEYEQMDCNWHCSFDIYFRCYFNDSSLFKESEYKLYLFNNSLRRFSNVNEIYIWLISFDSDLLCKLWKIFY